MRGGRHKEAPDTQINVEKRVGVNIYLLLFKENIKNENWIKLYVGLEIPKFRANISQGNSKTERDQFSPPLQSVPTITFTNNEIDPKKMRAKSMNSTGATIFPPTLFSYQRASRELPGKPIHILISPSPEYEYSIFNGISAGISVFTRPAPPPWHYV